MDLFGFTKTDRERIEELVDEIDGLNYHHDFISTEEEQKLIKNIDNEPWLNDLKRKVQHYGFKYDYRARKINESFRIGPLPSWCRFIIERMKEAKIIDYQPDQLIINNYETGEGIAMHVDCEPCFTDTIISLSLLSDINLDFKHQNTHKKKALLLKRRSLLVIRDNARYSYQHGIAQRKSDTFNEQKRVRRRRVSLTFRKVIL